MAGILGLWIDHQKAYLVGNNGQGEVRKKLVSEVEAQTRGSREKSGKGQGVFDAAAETKIENRRANQLKAWYREIIDNLGKSGAEQILIIGPGEAKNELLAEIEKNKALAKKIVATQTAEQLTENQIAAHVREYFNPDEASTVPDYRRPPGA